MNSLKAPFYVFLLVGGLLIWLMKVALEHLYYTYWVYAREMPDYLPTVRIAAAVVVVVALTSVLLTAKPWRLLRR